MSGAAARTGKLDKSGSKNIQKYKNPWRVSKKHNKNKRQEKQPLQAIEDSIRFIKWRAVKVKYTTGGLYV